MDIQKTSSFVDSYLYSIADKPSKQELIKKLIAAMQQEPLVWSGELGCAIPEGIDPEDFERARKKLKELAPEMFFDGAWANDGMKR
jgi:hypothetical protein